MTTAVIALGKIGLPLALQILSLIHISEPTRPERIA